MNEFSGTKYFWVASHFIVCYVKLCNMLCQKAFSVLLSCILFYEMRKKIVKNALTYSKKRENKMLHIIISTHLYFVYQIVSVIAYVFCLASRNSKNVPFRQWLFFYSLFLAFDLFFISTILWLFGLNAQKAFVGIQQNRTILPSQSPKHSFQFVKQ